MPLSFADRKAPSLPFLTSLALHCADRYRIFGHQGTSDQRSLHGPQDREFSIVSLRVDLRTLNSRLRSSLVFSTSSSFSVSSPTSLTEVSRTSAHSSSRYVVSSSSLFFLRSGCSSSLFPSIPAGSWLQHAQDSPSGYPSGSSRRDLDSFGSSHQLASPSQLSNGTSSSSLALFSSDVRALTSVSSTSSSSAWPS